MNEGCTDYRGYQKEGCPLPALRCRGFVDPGRRNNPPKCYLSKERVSELAEFPQGGVSAPFSMVQKLECGDIKPSFSVPIGFKGLTMSHTTVVGGKTIWQPRWVKAASKFILPNASLLRDPAVTQENRTQ
jgi:hypothetical protein